MIELQKLRYFVAVAETLHIGKAADQLHISQSPLSRQILALEERMGADLFTREKKRAMQDGSCEVGLRLRANFSQWKLAVGHNATLSTTNNAWIRIHSTAKESDLG